MRERVKGVGFEKRERMLEKLVRHPGDGPCVQPGVAVVEPRECGRVKRKRVAKEQGGHGEDERGPGDLAPSRS